MFTLDVDKGPYLRVTGDDVSLTIAGQKLTGSFSFEKSTLADGTQLVKLLVPSAQLSLADGLAIVNFDGELQISAAGLAGKLKISTPSLVLGPVTLTAAFSLTVNTATTAVVLSDGTRLPAGKFLRVEATNVSLTIGTDVELKGNFAVEQTTNALGQKRVMLAITGLAVKFGADQILSGGQGVLIVLPGGLAGEISGTISLDTLTGGAVKLGGTFALAINQTGAAVSESTELNGETLTLNLPKGPFVRISGTDAELTIAGQTLGGNFAFERSGTTTVIAASNVHLSLGGVVNLTGGEGAFVFGTTGLAGQLGGTISLALPGIDLGGTLALEINTTGVAIDRPVTVGGVTSQLKLDQGNYLRVGGKTLTLTIAGQKLAGDFSFEQTTTPAGAKVIRIAIANATLFLGDEAGGMGLSVTQNGTGEFTVSPAGVSGALSVTVALVGIDSASITLPPITVSFRVDTTLAAPLVRVELSTPPNQPITIFGQQLGGTFAFERVTGAGADKVLGTSDDAPIIRIAASDVFLFLGSNPVGVTISGGAGRFLITKAGIAGDFSATATIDLGNGIKAGPVAVAFAVNTIPTAVNESFTVGGKTSTLTLPAGPYLRASLTGLAIEIAGQRVTADFAFEKVMVTRRAGHAHLGHQLRPADRRRRPRLRRRLRRLRAADDHAPRASPARSPRPSRSTSRASPSRAPSRSSSTPSTKTVKVTGTNLELAVMGQKLSGEFTFEKDAAGNVGVAVRNVKLELGNGTTTLVTVRISQGAILLRNDGVAATMTASLELAPSLTQDFSFTGGVTLSLNTTRTAVNKTFMIGGNSVALNVVAGPYLKVGTDGAGLLQRLRPVAQRQVLLRAADDRQGHEGDQDRLQRGLALRRRRQGHRDRSPTTSACGSRAARARC